jgi:hypothetical protein
LQRRAHAERDLAAVRLDEFVGDVGKADRPPVAEALRDVARQVAAEIAHRHHVERRNARIGGRVHPPRKAH